MSYENTKIYCLKSKNTDEVYIGHTIQSLKDRLWQHNFDYKHYNLGKKYVSCLTSFKIIEKGDYDIELLEEYPCENKRQARKREGYYQRNMKCVNKVIEDRTTKEYLEDNKEKIKEQKSVWGKKNRERIYIREKAYRDAHKEQYKAYQEKRKKKNDCPCGGKYTDSNKAVHAKTKTHIHYLESLKL